MVLKPKLKGNRSSSYNTILLSTYQTKMGRIFFLLCNVHDTAYAEANVHVAFKYFDFQSERNSELHVNLTSTNTSVKPSHLRSHLVEFSQSFSDVHFRRCASTRVTRLFFKANFLVLLILIRKYIHKTAPCT